MDIAKKPTPVPVPLYPDPNAPKVPTGLQGPNEQSIVASGMTVEEWQRKHPRQVLGPDPEDVGQVTTDPPDGSEPEGPFPGTGTSNDPQIMTADPDGPPSEDLQPVGATEVTPDPIPVPEEPKTLHEMVVEESEEIGDEEKKGEAPWDSMSRHADLDAYAEENDVATPPDWSTMNIQEKRDYLTSWRP